MSSDRDAQKAAYLADNGFGAARREKLPGDASTRLYERLHLPDGGRRIFMDQPPSLETRPCPPQATPDERRALGYNAMARLAAGRVDAFVACAAYLRSRGLSAPEIIVADPAQGLAVLEDLGDDLYATLIAAGADEAPLYDAAVDALVRLHAEAPPSVLQGDGCSWPLLSYDSLVLQTGAALFLEWWPKYAGLAPFSAAAMDDWEAFWAPIRTRGEAGASVFCHRDYHAENLIWLPQREGPARVGLLDFQDALKAHPAWDFSMLLHDGRRDVSAEREAACLARYLAARPELDRDAVPRRLPCPRRAERDPHPVHLRPPGGWVRAAEVPRLHPADVALSRALPRRLGGTRAAARLAGRQPAAGDADMSAPPTWPATAMVLAAGLGTRMRPLTNDRPKALVEVGGKALIDHMLDRLAGAGVTRAVVNLHAFADRLEAHLRERTAPPALTFSDERAAALETGGGLKRAIPLLGPGPVWVANIDSVWIEHGASAMAAVGGLWDPARMDVCLLLAPTGASLGFHDTGDVFLEEGGRVRFKQPDERAPYVYVGVHITDPKIVAGGPDAAFSLLPIWRGLAERGRVFGVAPPGQWMHVGDPAALATAEARLRESS